MREALARSDNDFVLYERPPGRAHQRGRTVAVSRRRGLVLRLTDALLRRPGRTFGVLVAAGFAIAVAVNALVMQPRPHPAPLFAGKETAPPSRALPPPRAAEAAVPPASAPAAAQTTADSVPPGRPTALTQHLSEGSDVLPRPRPADPIGELIRTGLSSAPGADASIVNAQKALARLGYGVTPDGLLGPQTRQAIEQFERDRGLPVTGDLNDKVRAALAKAAKASGQ